MHDTLEFKASQATAKTTVRWMLYATIALIVLMLVFTRAATWKLTLSLAPVMLILWWAARIVGRTPAKGQTVALLNDWGLHASLNGGPTRLFPWADIVGASITVAGQARLLELQLQPAPQKADKRSFLTGQNPCRPRLTLAPLSEADQEALLDAIRARIRKSTGVTGESLEAEPLGRNEIREARELQEQLHALAPTTWVTLGLVAINVLIWLFSASSGSGWLQGNAMRLYELGGNATSAVQAGQWWRLLSAPFLHAHLLHLLFNMVGLWSVGTLTERVFGPRQFLLIYLVSAAAGSVASLYFTAQNNVSVGASGAVFGIAGALIMAVFQHRRRLPQLFSAQIFGGMTVFVGYSLLQGFAHPQVDNAAHVGGLLAGATMGWLLPERFDLEAFLRLHARRAATVLLSAAIALPWLAMSAPRAAVDVGARFQAVQDLPDIARELQNAAQALQHEEQEVKAGRLPEAQLDENTRTVHAPRFAKIVERLKAIAPHVPAPAQEVVGELLNLSASAHELLAMDSVVVQGKLQPADPARAAKLTTQMKQSSEKLAALQKQKR